MMFWSKNQGKIREDVKLNDMSLPFKILMFDWPLQDDMANASEDQGELLRKKVGEKWLIKCIISNRERDFFFLLQLLQL